jgi:hypothetical protein
MRTTRTALTKFSMWVSFSRIDYGGNHRRFGNKTVSNVNNTNDTDNDRRSASTANSKEYSHVTSAEYPNGDVEYLHNVDETDTVRDSRSVGWAMVVYGHNTNKANQTFYKTCLGVYQCPKCTYVERPRSLASNRSKQAPPLPAKGVCVADGSTLVHISCNAKMKVVHHHKGKSVRFIHQGIHNHAKPHPIRTTPEAQDKRKLQDVAESTSKAKKQSRKVL